MSRLTFPAICKTTNIPLIKRLRRADGPLRKTFEVIEESHPCLEIAQQLQAGESAIEKARRP